MRQWRFAIPGLVVLLLIGLLAFGLTQDPSELPSVLIDRPAPEFAVPSLQDSDRMVTSEELTGEVTLFNVWASWCVACRAEHELIEELAERAEVPVYGLNYKDRRSDALRWLERYGDPFAASAYDPEGKVGIEYGLSGVPETFVVDREGVIRYKQIGPVDRQTLEETLLPLLRRLKSGGA